MYTREKREKNMSSSTGYLLTFIVFECFSTMNVEIGVRDIFHIPERISLPPCRWRRVRALKSPVGGAPRSTFHLTLTVSIMVSKLTANSTVLDASESTCTPICRGISIVATLSTDKRYRIIIVFSRYTFFIHYSSKLKLQLLITNSIDDARCCCSISFYFIFFFLFWN